MNTGNLVRLIYKKYQPIKIDQIALLIEDDDSAYEIPSPISGIVKNIILKKGQQVKVCLLYTSPSPRD